MICKFTPVANAITNKYPHRSATKNAFTWPIFLALLLGTTILACSQETDPKVEEGDNGRGIRLSDLPQGTFQLMQDPVAAGKPIAQASSTIVKLERVAGAIGSGVFFTNPYQPSDPPLLMTNAHVLGYQNCLRSGCSVRLHIGQEKDARESALSIWVYLVPFAFSDTAVQPTAELKILQALDVAIFNVYTDSAATQPYVNPFALRLTEASQNAPEGANALLSSKAIQNLRPGDTVTLVGSPLGYLKKSISGRLAAKSDPYLNSELLTLPGTSGGAIFNQDGEFLALHHKGTQNLEYLRNNGYFGVSLATAVNPILELLKAENRKSSLSMFQSANKISSVELFETYAEAVLTSQENLAAELQVLVGRELQDQRTRKIELLWQTCEGSGTGDSDVPESHHTGLCFLAVQGLRCNPPRSPPSPENPYAHNSAPFQVCPSAAERELWLQRFAARAAQSADEQNYFWRVAAPLRLESSATDSAAYKKRAQALFDNWYELSAKQRRVTDALHSLDTATNHMLGDEDTSSWFTGFRNIPNYYYQYPSFLRGLYLLTKQGKLSINEASAMLRDTATDSNATLLDKLLSDFLDWRLQAKIGGNVEESPIGLP